MTWQPSGEYAKLLILPVCPNQVSGRAGHLSIHPFFTLITFGNKEFEFFLISDFLGINGNPER
jgi:hypothetical protein